MLFQLDPIISADFDAKTEIINLDKNTGSDNIMDISENSQNGYLVTKSGRTQLGLGLALTIITAESELLRNFQVAFGGLRTNGVEYIHRKVVPTLSEAKKLKHAEIPLSIHDLDSWDNGESLTLKQNGSLAQNFGIGAYGFGASVGIIDVEDSRTTITKLDENHILVNREISFANNQEQSSNIRVRMLKAGPISMNSAKVESMIGKSNSFIYDLSYPDANNAYQNFLKGYIQDSKELAKENKGVQLLKNGSWEQNIGVSTPFYIGSPVIPLIFARYNKEDAMIKGQIYNNQTKTSTKVSAAFYSQNTDSRLFGRKQSEDASVLVMTLNHTNQEVPAQKPRQERFARLNIKLKKNHARIFNLKQMTKMIFQRAGLPNMIKEIKNNEGQLGYIQADYIVDFSDTAMKYMLLTSKSSNQLQYLTQSADKIINSIYSNDEICYNDGRKVTRTKTSKHDFSQRRNITQGCRQVNKKINKDNTSKYIHKLRELAQKMKKNHLGFNPDGFIKIGKILIKSPILLRTVIAELLKVERGQVGRSLNLIDVRLSVSGEKVPRTEIFY